eukprot:6484490-Amphidinium_carterae.1
MGTCRVIQSHFSGKARDTSLAAQLEDVCHTHVGMRASQTLPSWSEPLNKEMYNAKHHTEVMN